MLPRNRLRNRLNLRHKNTSLQSQSNTAFNQFEVDKAIRAWGSKVTDPYDFGLAALYEKNYAEASKQLASSLDIREKSQNCAGWPSRCRHFTRPSLYQQGFYREATAAQDRGLAVRPDDFDIAKRQVIQSR